MTDLPYTYFKEFSCKSAFLTHFHRQTRTKDQIFFKTIHFWALFSTQIIIKAVIVTSWDQNYTMWACLIWFTSNELHIMHPGELGNGSWVKMDETTQPCHDFVLKGHSKHNFSSTTQWTQHSKYSTANTTWQTEPSKHNISSTTQGAQHSKYSTANRT